jgi:hypothetical protein
MQEKIFKNCFTLKLNKPEIESGYQRKREGLIRVYNRYIAITVLLISITATTTNAYCYESKNTKTNIFINFSSYVTTPLYLITFVICFISKNIKVLIWSHYLNYIVFLFTLVSLVTPLLSLKNINIVLIFFLYILEMLFRMVWVLFSIHSFPENLTLNLMTIVLSWMCYLPLVETKELQFTSYNLLAYSVMYLVIIGFSYTVERQQKNAFYFQFTHAKKLEWLTNVFENMNTGILSIRGNKISYINTFLQTKLDKLKQQTNKINITYRSNTEGKYRNFKQIKSVFYFFNYF